MTMFSCIVDIPTGKMLRLDLRNISAAAHKRSVELIYMILYFV